MYMAPPLQATVAASTLQIEPTRGPEQGANELGWAGLSRGPRSGYDPHVGEVTRMRAFLIGALLAGAVLLFGAQRAHGAFPQCPSVGADMSCQYLVTITDAGSSVAEDATQGPYEAADDSLIGVQNSSSKGVSSLPLSSPGTSLFGFE